MKSSLHGFSPWLRSSCALVPCLTLRTENNPSSFLVLFWHQKHLQSHLGRSSTRNVRWGTKQVPNFPNFIFFSPGPDQFTPCFGRRFGKFYFEAASMMSFLESPSLLLQFLFAQSQPICLTLLTTKTDHDISCPGFIRGEVRCDTSVYDTSVWEAAPNFILPS